MQSGTPCHGGEPPTDRVFRPSFSTASCLIVLLNISPSCATRRIDLHPRKSLRDAAAGCHEQIEEAGSGNCLDGFSHIYVLRRSGDCSSTKLGLIWSLSASAIHTIAVILAGTCIHSSHSQEGQILSGLALPLVRRKRGTGTRS